jgi:uncharacterized membrane protein
MSFCPTCGTALAEGVSTCPACSGARSAAGPGIVATATPASSAAGLEPNVAAALAYLAGLLTGALFLLIDPYKSDRLVRFHAYQSIFFNVAWIVFWMAWSIVGVVLGAMTRGLFFLLQVPVDLILFAGGFALWLYLMYSAWHGKMFRIPWIGEMAERQAGL